MVFVTEGVEQCLCYAFFLKGSLSDSLLFKPSPIGLVQNNTFTVRLTHQGTQNDGPGDGACDLLVYHGESTSLTLIVFFCDWDVGVVNTEWMIDGAGQRVWLGTLSFALQPTNEAS